MYGCCGGGHSGSSGVGGRSGGDDSSQVDPAAATCEPEYCQNGGKCQKDAGGGESLKKFSNCENI